MPHNDAYTTWEVEAERRREVLAPDRRPVIDDALDRPAPAAERGVIAASRSGIDDRRPDASRGAATSDRRRATGDGCATA
jgi:hypothetical protein